MVVSFRRAAHLLAAVLLVAVVFSSALLAHHDHLGSGFRPDCPGCQQERTIGSSSAAVNVAPVVIAPVLVGFLPEPASIVVRELLAAPDSSPRGPPPSLV